MDDKFHIIANHNFLRSKKYTYSLILVWLNLLVTEDLAVFKLESLWILLEAFFINGLISFTLLLSRSNTLSVCMLFHFSLIIFIQYLSIIKANFSYISYFVTDFLISVCLFYSKYIKIIYRTISVLTFNWKNKFAFTDTFMSWTHLLITDSVKMKFIIWSRIPILT